MLKLRAIDCTKDKAFYYDVVCPSCNELFVYKSNNSLLKQIWDTHKFEMDFEKHLFPCMVSGAKQMVREMERL